MTKTITLARALKEKDRIAGRITYLRNKISAQNEHPDKLREIADIDTMLAQESELVEALVTLKTAINRASGDILHDLAELAELEVRIAWVREFDASKGEREVCYGRGTPYAVTVGENRKCSLLASLQSKAESVQDILDEYNANTHLTIELPDITSIPCDSEKTEKIEKSKGYFDL